MFPRAFSLRKSVTLLRLISQGLKQLAWPTGSWKEVPVSERNYLIFRPTSAKTLACSAFLHLEVSVGGLVFLRPVSHLTASSNPGLAQ